MPKENFKRIERKNLLKNSELGSEASDQNKNSYKKYGKETNTNNLKDKSPSKNIQENKKSVTKKINKTEVKKQIFIQPKEEAVEIAKKDEEEIIDAIIEPRVVNKKKFNTPEPVEKKEEDVFGINNEKPLEPESLREDIFDVEPAQIIEEKRVEKEQEKLPIKDSQEDDVEARLALVKKRLAEIEELKARNQTEKKESEFTVGQYVKIKRSPSSGGQVEDGWLVSGFMEDGKIIVRGKTVAKEGGVNEYQQRTVTKETLLKWQELVPEIDIRETKNEEEVKPEKNDLMKTIVGARHRLEDLEKAKQAALDKIEKEKKREIVKATLEKERLSREKSTLDKQIYLLNTEYQKLQKIKESWWSKITFGVFVDEDKMMYLSDEIATLESQRNILKEGLEKAEKIIENAENFIRQGANK